MTQPGERQVIGHRGTVDDPLTAQVTRRRMFGGRNVCLFDYLGKVNVSSFPYKFIREFLLLSALRISIGPHQRI